MSTVHPLPSHAVQPESCLDWRQLWLMNHAHGRDLENAEYWDARSAVFRAKSGTSPYALSFLDKLGARPGETVIDMGCGTGAIALPLAAGGHRVTACDISTGMLDGLRDLAARSRLEDRVDARRVSWLDPWDDLPVADLFVASRSFFAADAYQTLLKIEEHTRRRAALTLATRYTPGCDYQLFEALGRPRHAWADHTYLVNMLLQMGRYPELSYITYERDVSAKSIAELREEFARMVGGLAPHEQPLLDEYVASNYREVVRDDGSVRVESLQPRVVRWAFVAWDVTVP